MKNLLCADDLPGLVQHLIRPEDPCGPEVRYLGDHGFVEEDVPGLEVPMYDPGPRVVMEILKPASDAHHDVQASPPSENSALLSI